MNIPELTPGSTRKAGKTDKQGRWYPHDDLLSIPGAFSVRSPSRAWPNSYLNHYFSKKFAKLLAINNPRRYFELSEIAPDSKIGKLIIAEHAKKRMLS